MSLLSQAKMSRLKDKHETQLKEAEDLRSKLEKKDVKEAKIIKKVSRKK